MVILKNELLTVEISETGAELAKITGFDGTEYLWNGDAAYWTGRAPVLFPICGGLKDNKCTIDGQEYTIPKHGFAKKSTFAVQCTNETSATLVLKSSAETLAVYPYSFEFRVIYVLNGNSLKVTYAVLNNDTKTIFCSVGAHEGYSTPEGIEDYKIVFEKPETLNAYILDGNLLRHDYTTVMVNDTDFELKDQYFAVDALVFKDLKSRSVTLAHKYSNKKIRVDFDGFNYFLLWHKYGAPYICIEPWCGIQDPVDSTMQLSVKEGINSICAGDTMTRTHVITING